MADTGRGQVYRSVWESEGPGLAHCYLVAGEAGAETDHALSGRLLHTDLRLSHRAAAKISDGSQYYVLLIITDGVISDMTQTKEAIVSVSLRRKACQGGVIVLAVQGL